MVQFIILSLLYILVSIVIEVRMYIVDAFLSIVVSCDV